MSVRLGLPAALCLPPPRPLLEERNVSPPAGLNLDTNKVVKFDDDDDGHEIRWLLFLELSTPTTTHEVAHRAS